MEKYVSQLTDFTKEVAALFFSQYGFFVKTALTFILGIIAYKIYGFLFVKIYSQKVDKQEDAVKEAKKEFLESETEDKKNEFKKRLRDHIDLNN